MAYIPYPKGIGVLRHFYKYDLYNSDLKKIDQKKAHDIFSSWWYPGGEYIYTSVLDRVVCDIYGILLQNFFNDDSNILFVVRKGEEWRLEDGMRERLEKWNRHLTYQY